MFFNDKFLSFPAIYKNAARMYSDRKKKNSLQKKRRTIHV